MLNEMPDALDAAAQTGGGFDKRTDRWKTSVRRSPHMKTPIHYIIPLCMAALAASAAPTQLEELKGPRFIVANAESIVIPLEAYAIPFPSVIQVSHVPGVIAKLTVTLSDLN